MKAKISQKSENGSKELTLTLHLGLSASPSLSKVTINA